MTDNMPVSKQEKSFEIFKQSLLSKIRQNDNMYHDLQKLSGDIMKSVNMLKHLESLVPDIDEHEAIYLKETDAKYVNLISPEMYERIMAYYNKHKNRSYSSKYVINKKIHRMLMSVGEYLDKISQELKELRCKKSELEERYYSTVADLSNRMNEYLSFLSKTLRRIAIRLGLLGSTLFYSLAFMSTYSPELLDWLKFVFVFNRINDILLISSYVINPNRKEEARRIKDRILGVLNIHRTKGYSLYIKFVYKLYDLLNAVMSFMKNLDIYLRGSRDWKDFYEKLEKHMLSTAGVSYKWLVDIVSFDLVAVDEFLRGLADYERLNTYRYKIRVTPGAISKLKQHYGERVRVDANWINVTLTYVGGKHYTPANPMNTKFILNVSGYDGTLEDKANFVMAAILLADEMILDNIYTTRSTLHDGILSIDLNQLKWLVYKNKSWIVRMIERILGRDKKYLSPEAISNELFESYIALHRVNNF